MSPKAWIRALCRRERLPDGYASALEECLAPLAAVFVALRRARARPIGVGCSGAGGSGKSTLALFPENWLREEFGTATATLSLDDLYLSKRDRVELARSRHPLFVTRGVPGTHDIALAMELIDALTGADAQVMIPVFDKARDDRRPASEWRCVDAPVDVVLFEGWCVGASPQPEAALLEPINALEAEEDADGAWRRQVNEHLQADYSSLFERLDALVYLRVPSFGKVHEWRGLQEAKLVGAPDQEKLTRFVSHFERLTRHMAEVMPSRADAVIGIDEDHRYTRLEYPGGT